MPQDEQQDDAPPPYSLVDEHNQQRPQPSSQQRPSLPAHNQQAHPQAQAQPGVSSQSRPPSKHHSASEKPSKHSTGYPSEKPPKHGHSSGWSHNQQSQSSIAQNQMLSNQVPNHVHHQFHGHNGMHHPPGMPFAPGMSGPPYGPPYGPPPGPLRYPPNYFCRECRNTGVKHSGSSCKDCWDMFGPRNNQILTAPHPPPGHGRVVMPGDPSIGGILCGRCRGTGLTHELLLFEETCRVCGGIGRIIR